MPTITFTVEGPGDGTGTLRFRARENYTNSDGEIVTTRDSLRIVAYTTNVQTSVVLPTGPWEVSGLATKVPVPFDVGSANANLKDLVIFPIPGNAPATTLSQAVAAWMDANVNTEVSDTLITEALTDPGSESRQVLDDTYVRTVNGVPVDPATGNVEIAVGVSLTDDGTGLFTINSGSTGLTEDGSTGLFTIGA